MPRVHEALGLNVCDSMSESLAIPISPESRNVSKLRIDCYRNSGSIGQRLKVNECESIACPAPLSS
jgi:hypothetical protein